MKRERRLMILAAAVLLAVAATPVARSAERSGIEHASGGVGLGAREAMLSQAQRYNLHLEFVAAPEGEYLSDVEVTLTDPRGNEVLTTRTEGPWLFVRLPPGNYKVTARYGAASRSQPVGIGEGRRRIVMRFPALKEQVAQDAPGMSAR